MARCTAKRNIEFHHKDRSAGDSLSNVEVLCEHCHQNTESYGKSIKSSPPPFSTLTKAQALVRANYQCECTRKNCHD
jgi:hypothetical protein